MEDSQGARPLEVLVDSASTAGKGHPGITFAITASFSESLIIGPEIFQKPSTVHKTLLQQPHFNCAFENKNGMSVDKCRGKQDQRKQHMKNGRL